MKKFSLILTVLVILAFVGVVTPALADTLEVLPTDHDFGDVEVGTTVTVIISMTNINGSDVEVYGLGFQAGGSADFSLVSSPPVPFIIVPGETVEVEVAFSPSAAGYVTAILEIESTDSLTPVHEVFFGGVGVATQPNPVTIQTILDFFDDSVEAGTLEGRGRPQLAKFRLCVMRWLLETAGELIEQDRDRAARFMLQRAWLRSDGLVGRLYDFVVGDARDELNGMILQLMADMGCEWTEQ